MAPEGNLIAVVKERIWSVMIPAYNAERFIGETLESVLAQAADAAQIVVVDDASTDNTVAVVEALGSDRVSVVPNEANRGAIATFNRCVELAEGRLVHMLHADDRVLPGFYKTMEQAMANPSAPIMGFCRAQYINENGQAGVVTRSERDGSGIWRGALETLGVSNRVRPPGVVVRRSAYKDLGGFRLDLPHAADWEMWTRLAAAGPIWFEDQVLSEYRQHDAQDTAARVMSGENIRERLECVETIGAHMPPSRRRTVTAKAFAYSGLFSARTAATLLRHRKWQGGLRQLKLAGVCFVKTLRTARDGLQPGCDQNR